MRIDDFDKFLTEIGNYDLLSKEEQQQLIRAVQEKGPDCDEAERLVKCNLRFVVGLANQYQKLGLSPAELITIGVEELRKAAMTYNLSIDIPFIRHAVPLMRQSMVEQTLPKRAIVYVDMDNVLVDFMSGIRKCAAEEVENYGKTNDLDDIPGVFSKMEPIEGAIDAFRFLAERFDTYILSTAPWALRVQWKRATPMEPTLRWASSSMVCSLLSLPPSSSKSWGCSLAFPIRCIFSCQRRPCGLKGQ